MRKHLIRIFLIFVIVATGLVAGRFLARDFTAEKTGTTKVRHSMVKPRSHRPLKNDLEAVSVYHTYEKLREQITRHDLNASKLEDSSKLFLDHHEQQTITELLVKIENNDPERRRVLFEKMYQTLTLADPNPDVLYGYLLTEAGAMVDHVRSIGATQDIPHDLTVKFSAAKGWHEFGQACLKAYQGTRDCRFLDLFVSVFEEYLPLRDDCMGRIDHFRQRPMKTWATFIIFGDTGKSYFYNTVTFTGEIVYAAVEFCRLVRQRPELRETYGEKAEKYLTIAEDAIAEFLDEFVVLPDNNGGYFIAVDNKNIPEPLNHSAIFGAALARLYGLTQKKVYFRTASQMVLFFLASVNRADNGAYWWGYRPTPENLKDHSPEPLWKARRTILLPIAAYDEGIVVKYEDMTALAKTFTEFVYQGEGEFNAYIGPDRKLALRPENLKAFLYKAEALMGWIVLDRFDPRIREIIEYAVASRRDLFPYGWFGEFTKGGAMAYAHRLREQSGHHTDNGVRLIGTNLRVGSFTASPETCPGNSLFYRHA